MIADLKADSARWDAERKTSGARGQSIGGEYSRDASDFRSSNIPIVEYRASTTHQSRQYYGPTDTSSSGFAAPQTQVQSPQGFAYARDQFATPAGNSYQTPSYPSGPDQPFIEGVHSQPLSQPPVRREQAAIPSQSRTAYPQSGYPSGAPAYGDSRSGAYYNPTGNVTPQQQQPQQYPQQQYSQQQQPPQQSLESYYGRSTYFHRHTTLSYYPPVLRMNGL